MDNAMGVAGIVAVAAITPGPNNFIILSLAAKGGLFGAFPAIAGIIAGSLGLLTVFLVAGAAVFDEYRIAARAFTLAGCLYLGWIGMRMTWTAFTQPVNRDRRQPEGTPATAFGLLFFQFTNPKSWILVTTSIAATTPQTESSIAFLFAVFISIPLLCLLLWGGAGAILSRAMTYPKFKKGFDLAMGSALILAAVSLAS